MRPNHNTASVVVYWQPSPMVADRIHGVGCTSFNAVSLAAVVIGQDTSSPVDKFY